ncbi:hypothetical protein OVY29_20105 [Sphingopyxis sp. SE2]|jgi:hypothetical protein|uniref:hypothetical protein n=1 Tax=unclassified Sphingopyxis TaxID=2614943 RepID=UPI00050EDA2E|nr:MULTISPECIES: hypothetical protein [unclassified Sphingopyxis]KGB58950.1 hypothetical protein FG95_00437 [Sphingopyxis sp. LC363]MDT7530971.1 hypothetical protein [Sphingopyxis sp. SE2]
MSALSTRHEPDPVRHGGPPAAEDYALGLQFCRVGFLSLTRLQLALERGDRSRAMEAIDDLHALDSEIERLVGALPVSFDDPRQGRVARLLKEGKMAVAFEKLALASGISGPDLSSRPGVPERITGVRDEAEPAGIADWPPAEPRTAHLVRIYGPRVAVLFAIAAATLTALVAAL